MPVLGTGGGLCGANRVGCLFARGYCPPGKMRGVRAFCLLGGEPPSSHEERSGALTFWERAPVLGTGGVGLRGVRGARGGE